MEKEKWKKIGILVAVCVAVVIVFFGIRSALTTDEEKKNPTFEEMLAQQPPDIVPTPKDPPIKDIYADYFLMGGAINGTERSNSTFMHQGMGEILTREFNTTTMSNLMKPDALLDKKATKKSKDGMPVCDFETIDAILSTCVKDGIKMRGHTLIWHNQTPEWFFYKDYNVKSGKLASAKVMEKRMESYIKQVITHCQKKFPGEVYAWDVVNECVSVDEGSYVTTKGGWKLRADTKKDNDFTHKEAVSNYWYATMGEGYVEKAFQFARKYAEKDVKLFYNDYNVFMTEKMENIITMVKQLKKKKLIDGIGLQPTVLLDWPELDSDDEGSFKTCLKEYAKLDLEIHITELSFEIKQEYISDETLQKQADRYKEFMEVLLEMDSDNGGPCNITSVTMFGIADDYPLYDDCKQNKYLWDGNCEPKPCYYSFIQPGLDLKNKK